MSIDDDMTTALANLTAAMPNGETRPGQVAMTVAVARAIASREHLIVQAGTGTGKTLGYLIPALLLGAPCVVATATNHPAPRKTAA